MLKPLVVVLPHNSGATEAKKRADDTVRALFSRYGTHLSEQSIAWNGDHADLLVGAFGARLKGEIDVESDSVKLTVHLPLAMLPMRGKIQDFLIANTPALTKPRG